MKIEHPSWPLVDLCRLGRVSHSGYYKFVNHKPSANEELNSRIAKEIERIHKEDPEKGYRRLKDDLHTEDGIEVNDKRVLRICRHEQIRSNLKYRYDGCTRPSKHPEYVAENILNRDFHADHINQKWTTDVTEFKYGIGQQKKLYLSAIIDLYEKAPISYVISDRNNNKLVFDTFDLAVAANPGAHPIFHSDRGYQYTSREFHKKLQDAKMIQSMSRVGKCIDNAPTEGFWGILKREMYYKRQFPTRESLVNAIKEYINKFIYHRTQRKLGVMTPAEYRAKDLLVA